jgi:hypothetical protein
MQQHGHAGQRDDSSLGRTEGNGARFHQATQNKNVQSKTEELFISGMSIYYF